MCSGLPGLLITPPYNVALCSLSKFLLSVYIVFYSYMEIKLILIGLTCNALSACSCNATPNSHFVLATCALSRAKEFSLLEAEPWCTTSTYL